MEMIIKNIPFERFSESDRLAFERLATAALTLVYGSNTKFDVQSEKDLETQTATVVGRLVDPTVVSFRKP